MRRPSSMCAISVCLVSACGGTSQQSQTAAAMAAENSAEETPPGHVRRPELNAALARGPGAFLQKLETEAHHDEGHFRGFRIVRFVDEEFFVGSGLMVGDIVLSINQHSVERPEEAFAVWEELRTANALSVRVLRNGVQRDLNFPIEE